MAEGFERFIKFGNMNEDADEVSFSVSDASGEGFSSVEKEIIFHDNHESEIEAIDNKKEPMDLFSSDIGMITPNIKPQKVEGSKPCVVVIDDDFSTLDLMKIYLQRDYNIQEFSNPRDAIFYMNTHLPDLIFVDCFMSQIPTKRIVSILRSYSELALVPIYYMADENEESAVRAKIKSDISGIITRPIARGKLQDILDLVFCKAYDTNESENTAPLS